jgi:hypothetical protein
MNQPGNYFAIAAAGNCAFFEALREAKVISGRSIYVLTSFRSNLLCAGATLSILWKREL